MSSKKNDQFAEIAMTAAASQHPELETTDPPELEERMLPLDGSVLKDFDPIPAMSRPEELRGELKAWKERFTPFLQNHAPLLKETRQRLFLTDFLWRIEEKEDRRCLNRVLKGQGSWENVRIPHYGPPLGQAVTYYRCALESPAVKPFEEIYICFKGADYKADIYINDICVGSHEGFFAPFEFRISDFLQEGENYLTVRLENDHIFGGSVSYESQPVRYEGNKVYAATGPGYDEHDLGWHHCPPGMGLYQEVFLEVRPSIHIHDIFVRPITEEACAEVWVEIQSRHIKPEDVFLSLSLYGQNFLQTVFEDMPYKPITSRQVGMGDSFTAQQLIAKGVLDHPVELKIEKGINLFKIPISIPEARIWEPDSPWLYQVQIALLDEKEQPLDRQKVQFGMRSFTMEAQKEPKGQFFLNNNPIRLRGANTMGHEQQCVLHGDWNQLIEDILLARICNMNFLRLTQRPVQPEVYDYCDQLGLMIQTDLPLFGVLKRDRFCEVLRQAEEMERLIRSHPSCIMVTYINEPFPNASNKPHRHLERHELEKFFECADTVVRINNPDRVIKHVDGDYDPPSATLPDNHCYTLWYNGHGIDAGLLHRGGWLPVRRGWNYGCGEFGIEGLASADLMRRSYPAQWLPGTEAQERSWSPGSISGAQTGNFHSLFFPTQKSVDAWVEHSQRWQAVGISMMMKAFRRNSRMVSNAVHLFIDAFPAGWMKAIMDSERSPKPAYFAYREALTPLMVDLRTDQFTGYAGQEVKAEVWICNDTREVPPQARLIYRVEADSKILYSGETEARIPGCSSSFQGYIQFSLPEKEEIGKAVIRAALADSQGKILHDSFQEIKVFPQPHGPHSMCCWTDSSAAADALAKDLSLEITHSLEQANLIIAGTWDNNTPGSQEILKAVQSGATLVLLDLPPGDYVFGTEAAHIKQCSMMPAHFAAPEFALPAGMDYEDFRFWYDSSADRITPFLYSTFLAPGFTPVMKSGNTNARGEWESALAAGECKWGKGRIALSQVRLQHRLQHNPAARILAHRLIF